MAEVFEICVKASFSAAHSLRGYPGDCARLHGHSFTAQVCVRCGKLDGLGMGVDFKAVSEAVAEAVAGLDHLNLNDLPAFTDQNPTAENLARHLYRFLSERLNSPGTRVSRVKVAEGPEASASYWVE